LNQESYNNKKITYYNKEEFDNKTKELSKSNLKLGDDKLDYNTETKTLYKNGLKQVELKTAGIKMINNDRKSNIDIMKGNCEYQTN